MPESMEVAPQHTSCTASTGIRLNRIIPTSASSSASLSCHYHSAAVSVAGVSEVGDAEDELGALQMKLHERTAQVEKLEALLSEKRFLRRHDAVIEERLRHYEEQLAQLAVVAKGKGASTTKQNNTSLSVENKKKEEEGEMKPLISVRQIMDDVYQLWYDKHRIECELGKKKRELQTVRAELQHAQDLSKGNELLVKPNVTEKIDHSAVATSQASEAKEKDTVASLERKLGNMTEKFTRVEKRLASYEKEYHAVRQTLREKEKKLLECQRKHQGVTGVQSRQSLRKEEEEEEERIRLSQWKSPKNMVSSNHRSFFRGPEWIELLHKKPDAMRTAFLNDASLELCAPCGFLSVLEMQPGPDVVAIEVSVRRPSFLSDERVEVLLMECAFTEMHRLLRCLHEPKEGWDLVQEKLNEAQKLLTEKESKNAEMQKRLQHVESLLARQNDERDAEDQLVNEALDETEKTVMMMYDEVKKLREKNEGLQAELQSLTETLASREKEIDDLKCQLQEANSEVKRREEEAAQKLDDMRRRTSTELRGVEKKWREEVSVLQQQHQQQIRKAAETTRVDVHSLTLNCSSHSEAAIASLDTKGKDILRSLLLCEAAVVANAIPRKVVSLTCTGKELKAEVELQVNALATDATRVAKCLQDCPSSMAKLFLQEWLDVNALTERCNQEIQRLSRELKSKTAKTEELLLKNTQATSKIEATLREEHDKLRDMEKSKAALAEELSCIRRSLGVENASLPLAQRVSCLVTALAKAEKSSAEYEGKWQLELVRANTLEEQDKELRQQYYHLTCMMKESKRDLENATEALASLEKEREELLRKCASAQDVLTAQEHNLKELQAKRRHKQHTPQLKVVYSSAPNRGVVVKRDETKMGVDYSDIIGTLRCVYEEYDNLYEKLENSVQEWRAKENAQGERLQRCEAERNELRQQLTTLQKELEERQEEARTVESTHRQNETEREELLSRIQGEVHALSKRLAKNDNLQRKAEEAKKMMELELTQLKAQCEVYESERKQLQEASALAEKEKDALEKKVEELQKEMVSRGGWAEEIMRQLVTEEDARRAAEIQLRALRRATTTTQRRTSGSDNNSDGNEMNEAIKEEEGAAPENVKRLRKYCMQTLKIPLTAKQQTVNDIVAFMEEHRCSLADEEELKTALLSMNTASKLLKQCVANTEEHKEGIIHRTPAGRKPLNAAPAAGNLRGFGRSLSYNSGVMPTLYASRSPRLTGGKSISPAPFARVASGPPGLHLFSSSKKGADPNELVSAAAEVVYLAQLLNGVATYPWTSKKKQNVVAMKKPHGPSGRTSSQTKQQQEVDANVEASTRKSGDEINAVLLKRQPDYDFLVRSRDHALCLALTVKDHLYDAMSALQPVVDAACEGNCTLRGSFDTNPTHELRIVEDCIIYSIKCILKSADTIFSKAERCRIEAQRGADYFTLSTGRHDDATSAGAAELPSTRTPKGSHDQKERQLLLQHQQQKRDFKQQGNGLLLRETNRTPSPHLPREKHEGSGACDGENAADHRRHLSLEEKGTIQRALIEARRRRR